MARRKRMSEDDLRAMVDAQINDARAYDGSDRADHRNLAIRFAEGEIDLPPMGPGRSKVVSRDVGDALGAVLPGLLRVFFATDEVVQYEPTRPEHEAYAQTATDYVNYVVMREGDGYRHFRNAFHDGVLLGNGIVKHWWDTTEERKVETYSNLSEEDYALLVADDDVTVIEHEARPDPDAVMAQDAALAMPMGGMPGGDPMGMDPMAALGGMLAPDMGMMGDPMGGMPGMDAPGGAAGDETAMLALAMGAAAQADPSLMQAMEPPPPPMLHDVTIERVTSRGRLRVECLPPEDFLIERDAKVIDETVRFCAHVYRDTRSNLIRMGFPRDKVMDASSYSTTLDDDADDARDGLFARVDTGDAPDASTEHVDVFECYVLVDYDGDGIAERRRIVTIGGTGSRSVVFNEEWGDDLPFSDIVPDPRPHTWRGRGLFDELADVQRVKTTALRGVLDNVYHQLQPVQEMEVDAYVNMDAVYEPQFGEVLLRKPGKTGLTPLQREFIVPNIFPVMEYFDGVAEKRVGTSMRAGTLDLDQLQNQSATAVNAVQSAAHAKVEEYARNIAECGGMKRIFGCVLKLITKHQDRERQIRLRGEFVPVDPRAWDSGMDVYINTGLGTGSRDRDLAMLQGVAGKQEQIIAQAGPLNEYAHIGHLFRTYRKMTEAAGVKNADSYFRDITDEEIEQARAAQAQAAQNQPPDPKMAEAQAKMQLEQQKFQAQMQADAMKLQADIQERQARAQAEIETMRERAAAELMLMREKAAAELQLAREKMDAQMQLKAQELQMEAQLAQIRLATPAPNNAATNIPSPV